MSTTYNIERSLDTIAYKLDRIIELLQKQEPKTNKELLLEKISAALDHKDLSTPWNNTPAYATTEDVLPEHRTYTEMIDSSYAIVDHNFTNNDTSIAGRNTYPVYGV